MAYRRPSSGETRLLRELLHRARLVDRDEWLREVRVESMDDGNMGSLRLMNARDCGRENKFGRELATLQFQDEDGVVVVATLNADQDGEPFELDIWRTDFAPLKKIPEVFSPAHDKDAPV